MFVLPSLGAILCDSLIVYLRHREAHFASFGVDVSIPHNDDGDDGGQRLLSQHDTEGWINIEATRYIGILASIRLAVLIFPLTYHTYTGTRIRFPLLYWIFQCGSLVFLGGHMLAILVLDPASVGPLRFAHDAAKTNGMAGIDLDRILWTYLIQPVYSGGDDHRQLFEDTHHHLIIMRYVWALLWLSVGSIIWHLLILWHVRSSAPTSVDTKATRRRQPGRPKRSLSGGAKPMLAYYAFDRFQKRRSSWDGASFSSADCGDETPFENDSGGDTSAGGLSLPNMRSNYDPEAPSNFPNHNGGGLFLEDDDADDRRVRRKNSDPPFLNPEGGRGGSASSSKAAYHRKSSFAQKIVAVMGQSLPDEVDEFMLEVQARIETAQKQWSHRLEEFSQRLHGQLNSGGGGSPQLSRDAVAHPSFFSPSPFRALLQMFAYEEVFSNGKLDAAFLPADGRPSEALSFYAPQLLTFLLHGAFLKSSQLEEWILEQCRSNVKFAHCCFWFLRSWCLGHAAHERILDPRRSESFDWGTPLARRAAHNEGAIVRSESTPMKRSNSLSSFLVHGDAAQTSNGSRGHHLLKGSGSDPNLFGHESLKGTGSKYAPEEHELVESLLAKIVDCGEVAVSASLDGSGRSMSGSDGPRRSVEEYWQDAMEDIPQVYGTTPREKFLATPNFLDSLISLADDLKVHSTSRSERTAELRRRLRDLESVLLPSTSVYVPTTRVRHHVVRIAADESVAISTKERVPCIVALEVLMERATPLAESAPSLIPPLLLERPSGSTLPKAASAARKFLSADTALSDDEMLSAWWQSSRPPQRHNNLFDKVSSLTQQGLRRLRDDIEDKIHRTNLGDSGRGEYQRVPVSAEDEAAIAAAAHAHIEGGGVELMSSSSHSPSASLGDLALEEAEAGRSMLDDNVTEHSNGDMRSNSVDMGQWSSSAAAAASSRRTPPSPILDRASSDTASSRGRKLERDLGDGAAKRNGDYGSTTPPSRRKQLTIESAVAQDAESRDGPPNRVVVTPSAAAATTPKSGRPPPVVFKEDWHTKEERVREDSPYGSDPRWRLLPILIKSNDDLRQEQLASQLIRQMAIILARAKVPVWLCPYEILALTDRGGVIEAIPDTISIDSLKKNDPDYVDLTDFFQRHFGLPGSDEFANAKANFVESLAGYSIVCFLLQIKDRHNGNILLDNRGHLIHIDFGFLFLSSPGKNAGFESAPFKLTREFVDFMDGPDSRTFGRFRELCGRTFLELRKHCYQVILLLEMLMEGNEELACFRNRPEDAVQGLRERFRLDLNDWACVDYVHSLIDESLENWRTRWYDSYQRICTGIMA